MNKFVGGFECLAGLLLALGFDVSDLICDVGALLIIFGALHYVFVRRLPDFFWPLIGGILFGPILLALLIRSICSAIWNYLVVTFGSFALVPLILGGLAVSFISFLYVRSRISPLFGNNHKQTFTNERQAVLPPFEKNEAFICAESDSLNEYSDEN